MRWQDGDGRAEIFRRLVNLSDEKGELPAESVDPGTDLPALHGAECVRELGGGLEKGPQPHQGTGVVARLG